MKGHLLSFSFQTYSVFTYQKHTFVHKFNFKWYTEELSLRLLLSRAEEAPLVKITIMNHDFWGFFAPLTPVQHILCHHVLGPVLLFRYLEAFP